MDNNEMSQKLDVFSKSPKSMKLSKLSKIEDFSSPSK